MCIRDRRKGDRADAGESNGVADTRPDLAAVDGFPDAAAGRAHVVDRRIAGDAGDHGGFAAAKRSDQPPADSGVEIGVDRLRPEWRQGREGEEEDVELRHRSRLPRFYRTGATDRKERGTVLAGSVSGGRNRVRYRDRSLTVAARYRRIAFPSRARQQAVSASTEDDGVSGKSRPSSLKAALPDATNSR